MDICGDSTKLVVGRGAQALKLFSLEMGRVTWLELYFNDRSLTRENFKLAGQAAREKPPCRFLATSYCLAGVRQSASGTVQAPQEIMVAHGNG